MENMGAGMGTLAINPQGSWLVGLLWFQDTLSWALPRGSITPSSSLTWCPGARQTTAHEVP